MVVLVGQRQQPQRSSLASNPVADRSQMLVGIRAEWIMQTESIHQRVEDSGSIRILKGIFMILIEENIRLDLLALVVMPTTELVLPFNVDGHSLCTFQSTEDVN